MEMILLQSMNVLEKILMKLDLAVVLGSSFVTLIDYMDIQHQLPLCIESKKKLMKPGKMILSPSAETYSNLRESLMRI